MITSLYTLVVPGLIVRGSGRYVYNTTFVSVGQYGTKTQGDKASDYPYQCSGRGKLGLPLSYMFETQDSLNYTTPIKGQYVHPVGLEPTWWDTASVKTFVGTELWNSVVSSADDKALKALDKRKVQGIVTIAEWHKTRTMLGKQAGTLRYRTLSMYGKYGRNTKRISKSARLFKRMPPHVRGARLLSIVTDLWLEFTYGVTPLIKDIGGLASAMHELSLREPPVTVATGYAKSQFERGHKYDRVGLGYSSGLLEGYIAVLWQFSVKTTYRSQESAYASFADFYQRNVLGDTLGVSWSEVAPAMWELIPYSFVVDYFVNVGEILHFNLEPLYVNSGYRNLRLTPRGIIGGAEVVPPSSVYSTVYSDYVAPRWYGNEDPFYFQREAIVPGYKRIAVRFTPPSLRQQANLGFLGIAKLLPRRILL